MWEIITSGKKHVQFWNGMNELPATAFEVVIDLADGEGM